MKDFVMKHPFFALCMTYTVCRSIENCILGHRKKSVIEETIDVTTDSVEMLKEHRKKKVDSGEIGFLKR
jgi:hypothetical protein